jgi:hypothetical protein
MEVIGYEQMDLISYVPEHVKLRDGTCINKTKQTCMEINIVMHDFEIGDDQWIGINADRVVERFPKTKEKEWRVQTARKLIESVKNYTDPIIRVNLVKSSAGLLGIDLPKFMEQLMESRNKGEDTQTFLKNIKSCFPS